MLNEGMNKLRIKNYFPNTSANGKEKNV